jgi:hypothetical protein
VVTERPQSSDSTSEPPGLWLTWWKLSIIAFACGAFSFVSGLLTGASAPLLWISTSASMGLGILFLAVELLTSASRPTLGIGANAPKTNRWRTRLSVLSLVLIMIITVSSTVGKVWRGGEGSGGSQSIYFYPPGDNEPKRCEPGPSYGSPN